MTVILVHAGEEPPDAWDASVFLAGPMPRTTDVPSWRPAAIKIFQQATPQDLELVLFVPEPRTGIPMKYDHHTWEDRWLALVDQIVFWVPRAMATLPGLTTNVEFGRWESSHRVVAGLPRDAEHVGLLREIAHRQRAPVAEDLHTVAAIVLDHVGAGSPRSGVERGLPLVAWRRSEVRAWIRDRHPSPSSVRVVWIASEALVLRVTDADGSSRHIAFGAMSRPEDR